MRPKKSVQSFGGSRGFSLIELMVALVVGLLIIAAAAQVFFMVRANYAQVQLLADRQNSIRFVTDSLVYDLRGVGRGGSVLVDGDEYEISYSPPRLGSFYCDDATDRLESITYSLVGDEITIEPVCESGSKGVSAVIRGLDEGGLFIEEILSGTSYRVRLIFSELRPGESDESRTFVFHVANKDQVISQNQYTFQ